MNPAPPVTDRPHRGRTSYGRMFVTFEGSTAPGRAPRRELLAEWLARAGSRGARDARAGWHPAGRGGARARAPRRRAGPVDGGGAVRRRTGRARRARDPAGPRARRRRRLRPLPRLVGRLPGHRPRPRRGAGARAEPHRHAGLLPDRTFSRARRPRGGAPAGGGEYRDRIEREDGGVHAAASTRRSGSLPARSRSGSSPLDGARPPGEIAEEVREHVRALL